MTGTTLAIRKEAHPPMTATVTTPRSSGHLLDFEGLDVFSLGADDSDTVVTAAGGFRFRAADNFLLGAAAEIPLTGDSGELTKWRVTADVVIRF